MLNYQKFHQGLRLFRICWPVLETTSDQGQMQTKCVTKSEKEWQKEKNADEDQDVKLR